MYNSTKTESLELVDVEVAQLHQLVLYNDEVNTFDFVIETLINVCRHDPLQAEQCTLIVHYNGKCSVKVGEYSELEPMCTAMLDRGLSADIQETA
ncbi:MAG: ATP-dependent Clp protease adaptor ClpS [Crocinitomicaceae bacterium]|nr:ATP-dependent Clp protease adaptor ClpS [Crocinitomicaceae bacterium]